MRVLIPPWNVGVAPMTEPLLEATVTLCATGEALVKAIVTLPDDAESDVVLYLSAPLGSAESVTAPPTAEDTELAALLTAELTDELPDESADEATDEADELTDEAADEAAEAIELLALDDPPQPASAVSPRRRAGIRRRLICISFWNRAMCIARCQVRGGPSRLAPAMKVPLQAPPLSELHRHLGSRLNVPIAWTSDKGPPAGINWMWLTSVLFGSSEGSNGR